MRGRDHASGGLLFQLLILPEETQKKVFGFDVWGSEHARFIPSEKDHSPRLLVVKLKHFRPFAALFIMINPTTGKFRPQNVRARQLRG